jgi:quercetin dioxygenase-like cupin family protein
MNEGDAMDARVERSRIPGEREAVWWQGALFRIVGRRETTGGALGMVEAHFWEGMATPLHVHTGEDESFFVLDGRIRFRLGDEEMVLGPGELFFGPRGTPHCFKVLEGGARAIVIVTPGGFEEMFIEGGLPVTDPEQPPSREYDLDHVVELSRKYGMQVVGPPLD